jgi:hypothetical protein
MPVWCADLARVSIAYHSTNRRRDGSFHQVVITPTDPAFTVQARIGD